MKRLEDLTNSVVQNRGNERDYSLRSLAEFEHLSKDCSIAKSYIPMSIDNSNIRHNLITAGIFISLVEIMKNRSHIYVKPYVTLQLIKDM